MSEHDEYGRTKLHYVVVDEPANSHRSLISELIASGFDPNQKDNQGWTPLHFAAQEWSEEAAKTLLENGAEVDITDSNGNTPLWRAVFSSRGRGELIKLLLVSGADPNKQNQSGVSPRSLADTISNYDITQYFD